MPKLSSILPRYIVEYDTLTGTRQDIYHSKTYLQKDLIRLSKRVNLDNIMIWEIGQLTEVPLEHMLSYSQIEE